MQYWEPTSNQKNRKSGGAAGYQRVVGVPDDAVAPPVLTLPNLEEGPRLADDGAQPERVPRLACRQGRVPLEELRVARLLSGPFRRLRLFAERLRPFTERLCAFLLASAFQSKIIDAGARAGDWLGGCFCRTLLLCATLS